jgi:hypothetical protein
MGQEFSVYGFRVLVQSWNLGFRFRVSGFGVYYGLGFEVLGIGIGYYRVWGIRYEYRVWGLVSELRVWDLGYTT